MAIQYTNLLLNNGLHYNCIRITKRLFRAGERALIYIGAEGRTRTGTVRDRLILSQVRLPIPPLRHNAYGY